MNTPIFKHKQRRLVLVLALTGFVIAAAIGAYNDLTDSSPPHFNFLLGAVLILFCPTALLAAPLIDVDPGTTDFWITWLIIAVLNSALYAVVGLFIGRFLWRRKDQSAQSNVPPASPRE